MPAPHLPLSPTTARLVALGERLCEAAAAGHWATLATLDAELAQTLRQLDVQRLDAMGRVALQRLHQLHGRLRTDCAHELERVRQTLNQMQQQRNGWSAYAESQDWGVESQA